MRQSPQVSSLRGVRVSGKYLHHMFYRALTRGFAGLYSAAWVCRCECPVQGPLLGSIPPRFSEGLVRGPWLPCTPATSCAGRCSRGPRAGSVGESGVRGLANFWLWASTGWSMRPLAGRWRRTSRLGQACRMSQPDIPHTQTCFGQRGTVADATVRIGVCRPRAWFECEDRRRAIPGHGLTRDATG